MNSKEQLVIQKTFFWSFFNSTWLFISETASFSMVDKWDPACKILCILGLNQPISLKLVALLDWTPTINSITSSIPDFHSKKRDHSRLHQLPKQMHYFCGEIPDKQFTIGFPSINVDPPQQIQSQFNDPKKTPAGTQNFDACPFGNSLLPKSARGIFRQKKIVHQTRRSGTLLPSNNIHILSINIYNICIWMLTVISF